MEQANDEEEQEVDVKPAATASNNQIPESLKEFPPVEPLQTLDKQMAGVDLY